MSAASELRAAAGKLGALAGLATPGPWERGGIGDYGWTVRDVSPSGTFAIETEDSAQGQADAAWIALMSPELAEPLGDLLRSIAAVHEQPPCDAPEACNRCAEPDPVIIDALRVMEVLKARLP